MGGGGRRIRSSRTVWVRVRPLSQEKIEMMKSGMVSSPQRKGHHEDTLNTQRKHLRKTITAKQPEKEEQEFSEKGQRKKW